MKKLVNDPAKVVPEMLQGFVLTNPGLRLAGDGVVVRADHAALRQRGQVALVSGGGAGHEPAHAGYVGPGMLTAAVVGDVFTSPSVDAVLAAIRAVGGPGGVLLIVKNYTGDRLNFGLAAEIARTEGHQVEMIVVADDAALAAGGGNAGRRGLAGTVLVHKVAGAAAEAGLPLAEVKREALAAAGSIATMGVALSACTVPAAGKPGLELAMDEIEWGLGIHGEPGVERGAIRPADEVVDALLGRLVADRGIGAGDRVVLLVNNLGGTPTMELGIVARRAVTFLGEQGIKVERAWVGTFLTALEMAGCSLSLARVDDQLLGRLDAPTQTTTWPAAHVGRVASELSLPVSEAENVAVSTVPVDGESVLWRTVETICASLIEAEDELTRLDQLVGDGDLGLSLARGARAVLEDKVQYDGSDDAAVLRGIAGTVRRVIGGTSGPLYAALVLRIAGTLDSGESWPVAFEAGVHAIAELGGAGIGDRTMLDALIPAAEALRTGRLADAVIAARAGTESTADIQAARGRSSYLGDRVLGIVDPGARAVVIQLEAVRATVEEKVPAEG
ncbi:dihydroxyacetone kinase family protein [Kribbella solani]|uniref:Dihydroxyacetone kinase n=1 Tax=Kribbella solani TaxID=236067 RepID=A0A841DWH0_9ACTN|nr:dihydroxyacetone kinase [Kribbella solani]